ncbi:MAG: hypothetical protein HF962_04365 [Sulfurovum sp.]|nr:hypothetical protein [Sulfurovum sp.]
MWLSGVDGWQTTMVEYLQSDATWHLKLLVIPLNALITNTTYRYNT